MRRRAAGFTLVEAVFCVVIVSVMFVAVMQTVAAARTMQYKTGGYSRGALLAQAMMAEIMQEAYEEPDDAPVFGPESPETATARGSWDDVDDYNGWSASPPQFKDGTSMTELAGWTRTVSVSWVGTNDLDLAVGAETDAKLITVAVLHDGVQMGRLVALRTRAFPETGP